MLITACPCSRLLVGNAFPVELIRVEYGNGIEAHHQVIQGFSDVPWTKAHDIVLRPDMRMKNSGEYCYQRRHCGIVSAEFDFQVLLFAEDWCAIFQFHDGAPLE